MDNRSLKKPDVVIPALKYKPPRPRVIPDNSFKSRRQQALLKGGVGGEPIAPVLMSADAAIVLQKSWSSKRTRKHLKRQHVAISVVQALVQGFPTRKRLSRKISRQKSVLERERLRLDRLRRIRAQERELLLLKSLHSRDFVTYERLRRHHTAKVLQKWWRRTSDKDSERGVSGDMKRSSKGSGP